MPEEYGGSALGDHRGGGDDAGDQRVGRGTERSLGRAHEHLRAESGGRVRDRGAEEALPSAAHRRQREGVLRGDRARRGPETTQLKTRAVRKGDRYVVTGQKVWISTAQVAEKMLLLARTTPLEEVKKATSGLSLFYATMDRTLVEAREIDKMGRKCVDSNQLFIDGLEIPWRTASARRGAASSTSCTA
jgi:acyl-CoA dehydrogenase